MRILIAALCLVVTAWATGPSEPDVDAGPSAFPVQPGSAMPPPAENSGHAAPPEGRGPGGVDFGQWRTADPAVYAPAFQAQMRQRFAGRTATEVESDLVANGFACENGSRLDCRIEIMERQCAFDWYVVVERGRGEPVAGFDLMCLGAQ